MKSPYKRILAAFAIALLAWNASEFLNTGGKQEMSVKIEGTEISDVKIVTPKITETLQGITFQPFNEEIARVSARPFLFEQQTSMLQGTIKGLHYQHAPYTQSMLVRVLYGTIHYLAVDLRRGSPTHLKWVGVTLATHDYHQLYVPRGFAHGLEVLSNSAEVLYKADAPFDEKSRAGIAWSDPTLGIPWQIEERGHHPIFTPEDTKLPWIRDVPPEELPVYEGPDEHP